MQLLPKLGLFELDIKAIADNIPGIYSDKHTRVETYSVCDRKLSNIQCEQSGTNVFDVKLKCLTDTEKLAPVQA